MTVLPYSRRALRRFAPLLLLTAACGALGEETEWPDQVTTGGAGPYRLATEIETGIDATAGQFLIEGETTGRAAMTATAVFYEVASVLPTPPPRDASLGFWEVDWAQHAPRRISRSRSRVVDADGVTRAGFNAGTEVLAPLETFETGGVYEPAVVTLPDGRVRLYYATPQGIGVAEAPTEDGVFVRLVTTPILPDVAGNGPAQHPAPLLWSDGLTHLYVAAGGKIFHASSADGVAFTLVDADPSTAPVDPLPLALPPPTPVDAGGADAGVQVSEVAIGGPTVAFGTSLTGRVTIRMAFESRRSDRSAALAIGGSFDAANFVRSTTVPYAKNNPTRPSLLVRDDGISLLSFAITRVGSGVQRTVSVLSMTPPRFDIPPF